jgi:hypothetical protein
MFILEINDGYAERVHLDNLCHLPGHTPVFVGYKLTIELKYIFKYKFLEKLVVVRFIVFDVVKQQVNLNKVFYMKFYLNLSQMLLLKFVYYKYIIFSDLLFL